MGWYRIQSLGRQVPRVRQREKTIALFRERRGAAAALAACLGARAVEAPALPGQLHGQDLSGEPHHERELLRVRLLANRAGQRGGGAAPERDGHLPGDVLPHQLQQRPAAVDALRGCAAGGGGVRGDDPDVLVPEMEGERAALVDGLPGQDRQGGDVRDGRLRVGEVHQGLLPLPHRHLHSVAHPQDANADDLQRHCGCHDHLVPLGAPLLPRLPLRQRKGHRLRGVCGAQRGHVRVGAAHLAERLQPARGAAHVLRGRDLRPCAPRLPADPAHVGDGVGDGHGPLLRLRPGAAAVPQCAPGLDLRAVGLLNRLRGPPHVHVHPTVQEQDQRAVGRGCAHEQEQQDGPVMKISHIFD
mmetsp:Transcript_61882/g.152379  ORF Transcript_61882/g.152379 Transcript_61882/m.152379 type:complete len:357 (-) Transcript_61882:729-1799(-)